MIFICCILIVDLGCESEEIVDLFFVQLVVFDIFYLMVYFLFFFSCLYNFQFIDDIFIFLFIVVFIVENVLLFDCYFYIYCLMYFKKMLDFLLFKLKKESLFFNYF